MAAFMRHTVADPSSLRIGGIACFDSPTVSRGSPTRGSFGLSASASLPGLSPARSRRAPSPAGGRQRWPRSASPENAADTPIVTLLSQSSSFWNVRPPEIMMPATGTANDPLRVRNIGAPLQPRGISRASSPRGAARTSSPRPAFRRTLASSSSTPALSSEAVPVLARSAPLQQRSSVLKSVDQVGIQYPEFNPFSTIGRTPSRPWKEITDKPKLTLKPKDTHWSELPPPEIEELANLESSLSQKGKPTEALRRTAKMMESMRQLRRLSGDTRRASAGSEAPAAEAPGEGDAEGGGAAPPEEKSSEEEDALLRKTLKELNDTEASLREILAEMNGAQKIVDQCGGHRLATQVIASRTAAVMQRKADLLYAVEKRLAEYEAAHAARDELLKGMVAGRVEAPEELLGVRKFIAAYTHKGGDPVDSDKSDFNAFAKSFLLPSRHGVLERFRAVSQEASDWWAKSTARVANEGAGRDEIKALIAMTVAAGAEKNHPYLIRSMSVLKNRIADRCLSDAEKARDRDAAAALRDEQAGRLPQVGLAEKAADAISEQVRQAIKDGVEESDKRIAETKKIAKALREADGQRKRMANREKNMAQQAASLRAG